MDLKTDEFQRFLSPQHSVLSTLKHSEGTQRRIIVESRSSESLMRFDFVPVEEFYFALTLAVRTLEDISMPELTEQVRSKLEKECGQPSTVAAASQNTFNYVFRVKDYDNSPSPQLIVSVADWQGKLRLSSDYGWVLDEERKPVRTEKFERRPEFAREMRSYLQNWLGVPLIEAS